MKKYCWIIFVFILAGCVPNSGSGLGTATATLQQSLPLTVVTPTVTWTASPTLTSTPTSIPSHPISTPIAKENDKITLELLRTNNDCDLPCWWGVIPNQTRWDDAEDFLSSFSKITLNESPTWSVYFSRSPLPIEFSEVYAVRTVFAVQEGLVKEIEAGYFDEETYHLANFLAKYGIPGQILVSTYSSNRASPPNQVPLSVNLYYPEKGINALYGTNAIIKGNQIISGCFSEAPHLFLWSPLEHSRSIDYILGWDKHNTPYMSVEEATDLDIQRFYEKYVNSNNAPCLETLTNLWPAQ